jgi:hypothetical protein
VLEAGLDVHHLQHALLLVELQRHVRGHGVGQAPRLVDAGERGQHLRRHLLVELDVLVEQGTAERIRTSCSRSSDSMVSSRGSMRAENDSSVVAEALDAGPLVALHQDLHRAVRKLQQLQDVGQGANLVEILDRRVVHVGALLGHQQDLLVAGHGPIQRTDGLVASHEERDDHVGVDDHVPQRQDGDLLGGR